MARLVLVSNRVAVPERGARAGGLAVALQEALDEQGGLWFGWSGEVTNNPAPIPETHEAEGITYVTVDLHADERATFYAGYSNSTVWPVFHYRLGFLEYRRSFWKGYSRVNANFAELLAPRLNAGDLVWVHDYHFMLMGKELRERGVTNRLGFFLHIPFPGREVLLNIPEHASIAEGLCNFDLVGFQTQRDVEAFADYLIHEAGATDLGDSRYSAYGRTVKLGAFPIGIDTKGFADIAEDSEASAETERLLNSLRHRKLILGVDRLDYSKGIPQRLNAYEEMLARFPEHRSNVTYLQVAPVSRGEVTQYKKLRKSLELQSGRINGRFAEFDWVPLRYMNKTLSRPVLAGFYRAASVALVTPLRDGMNLVAKEFVAAQDAADPGVLVLSRFAGAAGELDGAVLVNPNSYEEVAEAINRALQMPLDERKSRWEGMMKRITECDINYWWRSFVSELGTLRLAARGSGDQTSTSATKRAFS